MSATTAFPTETVAPDGEVLSDTPKETVNPVSLRHCSLWAGKSRSGRDYRSFKYKNPVGSQPGLYAILVATAKTSDKAPGFRIFISDAPEPGVGTELEAGVFWNFNPKTQKPYKTKNGDRYLSGTFLGHYANIFPIPKKEDGNPKAPVAFMTLQERRRQVPKAGEEKLPGEAPAEASSHQVEDEIIPFGGDE